VAVTAGYDHTDGQQSALDTMTAVVDADDNSSQAAGNRHAFDWWADHPALPAGTHLLGIEVLANVVSGYSSAALTKNWGTTANRWSTLYGVNADLSGTLTLGPITSTYVLYAGVGGLVSGDAGLTFNATTNTFALGANHIYSQGAHGLTLEPDDWAVGSGATSYARWDNSAGVVTVTSAGTYPLQVNCTSSIFGAKFIANGRLIMNFTSQGAGASEISQISAGGTFTMSMGSVGVGWLANLSSAGNVLQVVGSSGRFNVFTHQNTGTTILATTQGSFAAGFVTGRQFYFNAANATANVYGSGGTQRLWFDADNIAIGIGVAPSNYRMLGMEETGNGDGSSWYGMESVLTVNGNLTTQLDVWRLRAGVSGTPTVLIARGAHIDMSGINAGTWTTGVGVQIDALGSAFGTKIALRASGSGDHTRLVGALVVGADAAPTNSATLDVQGSLGVGAHGTTLANADAMFGSGTTNRAGWDDNVATWLIRSSVAAGNSDMFDASGLTSGDLVARFANTRSSGGTGNLVMELKSGASGGSPFLRIFVDGSFYWTVGSDNATTDDPFVIAASSSLAANRMLVMLSPAATNPYIHFNHDQADVNIRMKTEGLAFAFWLDGASAVGNMALLANAEPNWQSMVNGLFWGDATTAPTGNPTAGIFKWSEGGAGKGRGGGGTVTTYIPADPHCARCGGDFGWEWENHTPHARAWGGKLQLCAACLIEHVEDLEARLSALEGGGGRARVRPDEYRVRVRSA